MNRHLKQLVRNRAGHRCEYCHVPKFVFPGLPFPIDHIIARQHEGKTILSNLAYSCLNCNSHKGSNIAGIDLKTRKMTKLYHPRLHSWKNHFRWNEAILLGRTAIGRTTIKVLDLNNQESVSIRRGLLFDGISME